jgi:hypothetical protein
MYRSLLFDSPEPGTEVDRRMLLGNAGTVTLYVTAGSDAPRFVVAVASSDGVTVAASGPTPVRRRSTRTATRSRVLTLRTCSRGPRHEAA